MKPLFDALSESAQRHIIGELANLYRERESHEKLEKRKEAAAPKKDNRL